MTLDRLKKIAIVYLAYLFLGYGGIYLTFSSGGSLALLWLGSGVSLSALILYGPKIWPAIWLGSFTAVAPLMMQSDALTAWWQYLLLVPIPPTINVLVQSLFAYLLYQKLVGPEGFSNTSRVAKFVFIVITVPTLLNSGLLVSFYSMSGIMAVSGSPEFMKNWLSAGLGDIHGYFILTPVAIAWLAMRDRTLPAQAGSKGFILLLLSAAFVLLMGLSLQYPGPIIYLLVPLAVVVGLNFGLKGTSLYIFLMSAILTIATANGVGPFIEATATDSLISLLTFVFSMGIPMLIIASERLELQRHQADLEDTVAERTRELSHAVAAKDEFLATISHELRTPLHAILGVVRVLDTKNLSKHLASRIQLVETAGESLLTQINSILTFIRFSNDTEELPRSDFELHGLIHVTAALMEETAQAVGSEIRTEIDPDVPSRVNGSPEQLRQILFNLLSNAVKYGVGSPITLRVTPADDLRLCFSVEDQGPGISIEDQQRIFEKFSRINPDQTTTQGTGLGLAISKRLAERMSGEIQLESDGIQGTKIIVELPFSPAVEQLPKLSSEAAVTDNRYQILLLEDDPVAMQVSRDFLELRGHHVVPATTAREALELLRAHPIDLLVSDINLPDMSGLELAKHLQLHMVEFSRELHGKHVQLTKAALTASVLPAQEISFREAGFEYVLTKPLDQKQLDDFFSQLDTRTDPEELPLVNRVFVEEELLAIGEEVYTSVLNAFVGTFAERLSGLSEALQQDDTSAQIRYLHLLGSGASNLGLARLQKHCRLMEEALKQEKATAVDVDAIHGLQKQSLSALSEFAEQAEVNPSLKYIRNISET